MIKRQVVTYLDAGFTALFDFIFNTVGYRIQHCFDRRWKCSSHFWKWGKREQFSFFNGNPNLVTYYSKGVLTIQITMLRKGFYDISGLNGGLSKFTSYRRFRSTKYLSLKPKSDKWLKPLNARAQNMNLVHLRKPANNLKTIGKNWVSTIILKVWDQAQLLYKL